jgi:VIT1/CCC1 family predicted Fe2+/Mn2+ transporter
MILNAIIVIFLFSFYISVAKDISFKKRFLEMSLISLGVAALAFGIGLLARIFLHLEI